jgi:hypothetical protein
MDDALAKALLREVIEPFYRRKILREPWLLKFWVCAAEVIALEFAIGSHSPGEKSPAQRAVAEGRDLVLAAIGQDIGVDCALERL